MNGCIASGKFEDEKNTPESSHIGSITRFTRPETASTVLRAARHEQADAAEGERADEAARRRRARASRESARRRRAC